MNFICYQNDEEKEDSDSDMKKKVRFFTDNILKLKVEKSWKFFDSSE